MKHTKEQLRIIKTDHPRTIVSAAAGSGKTATLCARLDCLVANGIPHAQILVLSFSNRAVNVLQSRLTPQFQIKTFHALGLELASKYVSPTGDAPRPRLVKPHEHQSLLKTAIIQLKLRRSILQASNIDLRTRAQIRRLSAFLQKTGGDELLATRLIADRDSGYTDYAPITEHVAQIRKHVNEQMAAGGLIDYASMIRLGILALETERVGHTHVLVDEFQDMNETQGQLLAAIAAQVLNIMVFGDPRQAIFGFAGRRARNMERILGNTVSTLHLSRSFRLTHESAALANEVMKMKGTKPVLGDRDGLRPALIKCKSATAQEQQIVELIKKLLASDTPASDIAIVGRIKSQLRLIDSALIAARLNPNPHYAEREMKHVFRMLELLMLLRRKSTKPLLRSNSHATKIELQQLMATVVRLDVSPKVLVECRKAFVGAALSLTLSGRYTAVSRIYCRMVGATGIDARPIRIELGRWAAVAQRFKKVSDLSAFIKELESRPPVILSTIHGAKGAEWDHVIVCNIVDGSLPFFKGVRSGELEEERRLMYVAVTRARICTHMFQAPYHHSPTAQVFDQSSPFLAGAALATTGKAYGTSRRDFP